ncbi:hypothetical protein [Hankyongella ginsenosidimutans]|uniref:hypothetical protein n=1 Tax=Hankyongella ginsenosidimutans TaxID=1763828 RepID=UPI001FEBB687|nr:hypothetical protein [Hankyongella ginsenosidimutans]
MLTAAVLLNYSRSMAGLFEFMILLSSAITLVMYVGVALAAARLIAGGRLVAGLASGPSCWWRSSIPCGQCSAQGWKPLAGAQHSCLPDCRSTCSW